jgi:adenylate cyclase
MTAVISPSSVKGDRMTENREVSFFKSITFRIPLIILIILLIGIGGTISWYSYSQNRTIIQSKESGIRQEAEILYTAVKNNMLAGEAPIAVELFRDFTRADFVSGIELFRADGTPAFSDNSTVKTVNSIIGEDRFDMKTRFILHGKDRGMDLKTAVEMVNDIFIRDVDSESKKIVVYKPLINQPKCSGCHGLDHVVRGVIKISSPVDDVYAEARKNVILSVVNYSLVTALLTAAIIAFLRITFIRKILRIGEAVGSVGKGDFKVRLEVKEMDELGALSQRINSMIEGLNERFRLTKFVSKSTLDHVRSDEAIELGGERKRLTVLFSDIRGFTSFSENNDPEVVLAALNKVMNIQAEIIHEFEGDIDKFVGDELMAVFEGSGMELRAVKAAEKIRAEMLRVNKNGEVSAAVGIGINTGGMISGNMGSAQRIDRTVIGDAVNLGARLCSAAGRNTIVISESTYSAVRDRVEAAEHPPIKVKGKEMPVAIYTLRRTL